MSNSYNRQQQERNDLILGLLLSLFIHGAIALVLSRFKAKELVSVEEEKLLTPITIVELDKKPNLKASSSTSSPNLSSRSTQDSQVVAPKAPSEASTLQTTAINPPPEVKPSPTPSESPVKPPTTPKTITETSQTKSPTTATKPDSSLLTKNKTPVTSPTPVKLDGNSDRPTAEPKIEPTENNKPLENDNLAKKQRISALDKPVKPPASPLKKPIAKKRSPNNSERNLETSALSNPSNSPQTNSTDRSQTNAANNTANESPAPLSIACEDNCQPEYPDVLDGSEGTAGIQLTIDRGGQVIDAEIAVSSGNFLVDNEALEAAKQMEFSKIDRDRAIVQINLSFAVPDLDEW
ncbi:energy transducer TonB [Pleurocapsa sp. PCC 7319]|uniref:energy transducer TonB n=1 Tax=Pleurocapsa sp. PCC 7319 TaxID=118161 RepID=UPI00036DE498|nr:energy transducer TonB [Pleurocapsa sp. PCC 7319]